MAVRSDRNYPSLYFGRPGSLITMPYPRGDMDRSYERPTFDFATGSGQHMVSSLVGGSRPYTVSWEALHVDTYKRVEQYWTGMMGTGPWVFIDPSMTNMLRPNQSSAGNAYYDTRHWVTAGGSGGTLATNSNATHIHRPGATRSMQWLFGVAAAGSPELSFTYPYRSWFGFPVVPTLSYAWSAWLKPDGVVDASITLQMKMQWVDAAGASISDIGDTATAVTAWTQRSLVGVAPAGAAFVRPRVVATSGTITTGGSVYIDEPMLEQDTVVNDWAPGTGLRPVEILGFNEPVPFAARFRKSLALTLRELAQ